MLTGIFVGGFNLRLPTSLLDLLPTSEDGNGGAVPKICIWGGGHWVVKGPSKQILVHTPTFTIISDSWVVLDALEK